MKRLCLVGKFVLIAGLAITSMSLTVAADEPDIDQLVDLLELVLDADADTAKNCLNVVTQRIQTGELPRDQIDKLRPRILPKLKNSVSDASNDLHLDASLLSAQFGNDAAITALRSLASNENSKDENRLRALDGLASLRHPSALSIAVTMMKNRTISIATRGGAIAAVAKLEGDDVSESLLSSYPTLEKDLQPRIIESLTQRPASSRRLLDAVAKKSIPRDAINENQVRKMLASRDMELVKAVQQVWGAVRLERNPDRERVIGEMRKSLAETRGDAGRGKVVFQRVCGQCHRIYGDGQEVGPDLTSNGRSSFDQLLSNVLDPSLVIGASYQARTVITNEGRILTGLLAEDNEERIVLKVQGGKVETIPRSEIDEVQISKLSLMPEGLEKQLQLQEIIDLFWFLCLDKPPTDPSASRIPGTMLP